MEMTNFHFEISADLLREEELQLMKTMRPGLIQLEIGVQSTNPQTIRAIHRTMDFEKLTGIVNQIHSFQKYPSAPGPDRRTSLRRL